MEDNKIITEFVYPPIPDRSMDWTASREGWDLGDPIGSGETESEAIEDLILQEEELFN